MLTGIVDDQMSDPDAHRLRPLHFRAAYVAAVWLGGTLGTGCRYALGRAIPHVAQVPVGTLVVNVTGAFVLGVLLARLVRAGPDDGRRRGLRLIGGTGFLGGFTTYSALALDTVTLAHAGWSGSAGAYAVGTVVLGAAASLAGIRVGQRGRRG